MYCFLYTTPNLDCWHSRVSREPGRLFRLPKRDMHPPAARGTILLTPLRKVYDQDAGIIDTESNPWFEMWFWHLNVSSSSGRFPKENHYDGLKYYILWFKSKELALHFRLNETLQKECGASKIRFLRSMWVNNFHSIKGIPQAAIEEMSDLAEKDKECVQENYAMDQLSKIVNHYSFFEEDDRPTLEHISKKYSKNRADALRKHRALIRLRLRDTRKKLFNPISDWQKMERGRKISFKTDNFFVDR